MPQKKLVLLYNYYEKTASQLPSHSIYITQWYQERWYTDIRFQPNHYTPHLDFKLLMEIGYKDLFFFIPRLAVISLDLAFQPPFLAPQSHRNLEKTRRKDVRSAYHQGLALIKIVNSSTIACFPLAFYTLYPCSSVPQLQIHSNNIKDKMNHYILHLILVTWAETCKSHQA